MYESWNKDGLETMRRDQEFSDYRNLERMEEQESRYKDHDTDYCGNVTKKVVVVRRYFA